MKQRATTHQVASEEIMQLMDGELVQERAEEVAAHAESCVECRDVMRRMQESSAKLATWTVRDSGEARQGLERLRNRANARQRGWRAANLLRPRYVATACAVLLALTFWAQLSPSRIHVDEQTVRAKLKSPNPKYPEEARRKRIQGDVRVHIVVARDGSVKKLRVLSGDPVLAKAAVEGVRQWKFEPTMVDGKAVEVESDVQIEFKLYP